MDWTMQSTMVCYTKYSRGKFSLVYGREGLLAIEACVREYHACQDIWEATISEELLCERQPMNPSDRYAVA